jgi:hypothetical protein
MGDAISVLVFRVGSGHGDIPGLQTSLIGFLVLVLNQESV